MIYHVTHRRRIAKKHANRFARMVGIRIRQARGHVRRVGLFEAVTGKRFDMRDIWGPSRVELWTSSEGGQCEP